MDRLLIIGDVHLGKGLALGKSSPGGLNSRILDQVKLLDWIVEQAEEHLANILVLTGDIFEDSKPDYRVFQIFLDFLRECQNKNLEVHIILGNHELRRTGGYVYSPLAILDSEEWPNIFYHKNITTIHKNGFSFTVLPFADRRSLGCATHQEAIESIAGRLPFQLAEIPLENKKILIGHLALEGAIYIGDEIDDQSNELHCPFEMFTGYDYVWMGHVHKPQVMQKNPNYLAHIGSLDLSNFGEINQTKILILFDLEKKEKFSSIRVPSRPLCKFSISVPLETVDVPKFVRQEFENQKQNFKSSILSLEIFSAIPFSDDVRAEIKKIPFEFGVFHVAYFLESHLSTTIEEKNQDNETNSEFQFLTPKTAIENYSKTLTFLNEEKKKPILRNCLVNGGKIKNQEKI